MEDIRKVKVGMSRLEKDIQAQQIKTQVLQEVSDGSPKEIFQTLTRLEDHYPTGAPGVFLVMENSDGKAHWYYWNVSMWVDGGVYIDADLSEYAKTDGSYELLTSGNAMQLINPYGNPVDKAKFDIRETYDGAEFTTGIAKVKKIKGFARKSYNEFTIKDDNLNAWATADNDKIYINGTPTYDALVQLVGKNKIKSVAVKLVGEATKTAWYYIQFILGGASGSHDFRIADLNEWVYLDVSEIPDFDYLNMYLPTTSTFNACYLYIMVNTEKSLRDLPYEKHFNGLSITAPNALISIGRNLWDEQWEVGDINWADGTPITDNSRIRSKNFIPCIPFKTYAKTQNIAIVFYDKNKSFLKSAPIITNNYITFNTPANAYYMKFSAEYNYGTTYKNDIMINFGSEPLPYEPYTDTGISLAKFYDPFRHKGYGCYVNEQYYNELDLDKKVLIHRVSDVKTLTSENIVSVGYDDSKYTYALFLKPSDSHDKGTYEGNIISDMPYKIVGNGGFDYYFVAMPLGTTLEQAKSLLNDYQYIYALATPTVEDVSTLFDTNKYKAIGHGQEYWLQLTNWFNLFTPSVPCEIEYQPDMAGKLAKLRTAPEQENIDTEQDRRIKALEDRIAQLTIAINGGNQQ